MRGSGFKFIKENYIIDTCEHLRYSKRFIINTDDNINPDNKVYPYSRVFLYYYGKANKGDRCYLYEHAVFDILYFVCKRKSELSYYPIAYFETKEEAEQYVKEMLKRKQ